jgi:23S rRNA (guanosine2251-2'-O)-methyltransferase
MDRYPPRDQLIMGLHAVQEVLKHAPDRFIKVFTSVKQCKGRKDGLLAKCEEQGIAVQQVGEELLSQITGSDSHQSFVAHLKGRTFYDAPTFFQKVADQTTVFVLMLDQIYDPHNFGALLRSAECFGVDAVAYSKNRGCDITPTVAKTSCGATELLTLIRISNLVDTASKFQDEGYEVVAALADPEAESLSNFAFAPKTVLILGSEGEGIQPLLRKKADRKVTIPLQGKIESLNVSQAAAALLSKRY